MASTPNRADIIRVSIAYLSFVVIGVPTALYGVATPYIRQTFGLSLSDPGALFITTTIGYFVASTAGGRMAARFGAGWMLMVGSLLMGIGVIGYGLSPVWIVMLLFGLLVGTGSGFIDAGMNIYFAAHYGPRLMNWLHACFGIGSTVGPLLITGILNGGGVWQTAYMIAGVFCLVLALLFFLTRGYWQDFGASVSDGAPSRSVAAGATLRLPIVWIGIAIFFIYAAMEVLPGQWSSDLFTRTRGVTEEAAGVWISIYWASFTIGRIFFGVIVTWLKARTLVWICLSGALVGLLLYAWNPVNTVGFAGLAVIGFGLAPIFALLITNTQEQLGAEHAPNAIGFQVAAASLGIGIMPGAAGILAEHYGLEVLPTFFIILMIVLMFLYGLSLMGRLAFRRASVAIAK